MARVAVALGVFILSGFISLSAAKEPTCELYAAVGQSVNLPFEYPGLVKSHVLRWTHNNTVIFYGQPDRTSIGKPTDISANGSLLLKNVQFSRAGIYEATLLHPNATLAKNWTGRLCVMDKVSKPQLTYNCDFKANSVHLNCVVAKPHGLVFSWALDEKTLTYETRQTLSISLAQLKAGSNFTCSVANKVSKEKSDAVPPICKRPSPPPAPSPLCFEPNTVRIVLAGGVSLILILLSIIILLCCCHRCNKTQMAVRDNYEVRMLGLSKQDSTSPDYETMHPAEDSTPEPEPVPRVCYENVSQPEAQTESSPSQLSTAAEGLKPSPVPKPRTKNPPSFNI